MAEDFYFMHRVLELLERIDLTLQLILEQEMKMDEVIQALTVQVAETKGVMQSAITLIQQIATKLEAFKDDPVQIQALSDELKAQSDALAAAVLANTP